jgi:uncharacterized repeat protein (TIGR01451 family)
LVFRWALSGSLAASGDFLTELSFDNLGGFPFADYRACGENVYGAGFICFFPLNANVAANETVSVSVPVVFGSPTIVDWRFNALITSCGYLGGASPGMCTAFNGTNAVDFFNTAQLQPVVVLDSNGNQISGASVVSDSGYSYGVAAPSADLSVTQTDLPDPVGRGDNITYTVVVKNNGPSAATAVSLSDVVPSDAKFVSNSGAAGWICTNPPTKGARTGTIACTIASLASGASATFTIVVETNAGTKATTISNTAVVSSSTDDPASGNNAATATTTVRAHK